MYLHACRTNSNEILDQAKRERAAIAFDMMDRYGKGYIEGDDLGKVLQIWKGGNQLDAGQVTFHERKSKDEFIQWYMTRDDLDNLVRETFNL
ncbi:unnamed protein product [Didymodactylos carnosus]|uniref:EF-hand domain-containing protein n=1 Tax=Didymodactylos carnosus TaxID=1234261 RepID=A0A8S2WEM8_9BILA|nr:unnamed protein product [Didymodactylos carnosus]